MHSRKYYGTSCRHGSSTSKRSRKDHSTDSNLRLRQVEAYLRKGCLPATKMNTQDKQTFLRLTEKFQLLSDGQVLHYIGPKKTERRLVIFDEEMRKKVLKECHDDPGTGGHQGIVRTQKKVTMSYYWMDITKDVNYWIKTCLQCQKHESIKTQATVLHPIEIEEPWAMVGVDLIGPFPTTEKGNSYACTMTDLFTKWTIATSIKDKSAVSVGKVLVDTIYRFGPPRRFLTDQGQEFVNNLNEEICKVFGVKQAVTSAYHPQTNGQDKRTNQTIKSALSKYVNDHQDDWDDYLTAISYAINTSVQTSTKFTPFFLMYGRHHRTPLCLNTDTDHFENYEATIPHISEDQVQNRVREMVEVQEKALTNIKHAQDAQKKNFERRKGKEVKNFKFQVGQEVWRRDVRRDGLKGDRLMTNWVGIFKIHSISVKGVVHLLDEDGRKLKKAVNMCQLKPVLPL